MQEEQMEFTLFLPAHFPLEDLFRVGKLLEVQQILTPGYIVDPGVEYDPRHYLYEVSMGVEFIFLIDRNIASRMAQLAQGMTADQHLKTVAGVLAFAQCLEVLIEPSIAFHEVAPFDGNESANLELAWLRVADNCYPPDLLSIALGRSSVLPTTAVPADIDGHRLNKRLSRWQKNHIAALKIAELELFERGNLNRVLKLLEWMYTDFILALPAALYACIYFAPINAPRAGMFKMLRSPNRTRAIEGVKNAAWDITYLSDFAKRISEGNISTPTKRITLVTGDYSLRQAARMIAQANHESLSSVLEAWWPKKEAAVIAKTIHDYVAVPRDEAWFSEQAKVPQNYLDGLVDELEQRVTFWTEASTRNRK